MAAITTTFANVWRDFVTAGVTASGLHEPVKAEIRAIGPLIEAAIGTVGIGALVDVVYATRAALNANLVPAANSVGLVYADPTDANNDLYVKVGGSGVGSWTLTSALHDIVEGLAQEIIAEVIAATVEPLVDDAQAAAVSAAASAGLATSAASAAARYFVSQAAGEAGSAIGQFFSHPDGAGGLVYRERTAGGSILIAEVPTKAQLDRYAAIVSGQRQLLAYMTPTQRAGCLAYTDTITDIVPIIQAAVADGAKEIVWPAGRLNFKSKLSLIANVTWKMAGTDATRIHCDVNDYAVERLTSGARLAIVGGYRVEGLLSHPLSGWCHLFDCATYNIDTGEAHNFSREAFRLVQGVRVSISKFTTVNCGDEKSSAVTMDAATDIVTWVAHGIADATRLVITTNGTLLTGIAAKTVYWTRDATANGFKLAATPGGAAIDLTGAQSGTHIAYACRYAAIWIDKGATASVAVDLNECYIAGGGIGVLAPTARVTGLGRNVFESTVIALVGDGLEGFCDGWFEANVVDLDLTDSSEFELRKMVSTFQIAGVTRLRWVGSAGVDRALFRPRSMHAWMANFGDQAFVGGAWGDILLNARDPYYRVTANPGGGSFAIIQANEPGDYEDRIEVSVRASSATARDGKLQAMLSIDGGAFAEIPYSSTKFSVVGLHTIPVHASVRFTVPIGSTAQVKWRFSPGHADLLISSTGNVAGGAPAASGQECNVRRFMTYLGSMR